MAEDIPAPRWPGSPPHTRHALPLRRHRSDEGPSPPDPRPGRHRLRVDPRGDRGHRLRSMDHRSSSIRTSTTPDAAARRRAIDVLRPLLRRDRGCGPGRALSPACSACQICSPRPPTPWPGGYSSEGRSPTRRAGAHWWPLGSRPTRGAWCSMMSSTGRPIAWNVLGGPLLGPGPAGDCFIALGAVLAGSPRASLAAEREAEPGRRLGSRALRAVLRWRGQADADRPGGHGGMPRSQSPARHESRPRARGHGRLDRRIGPRLVRVRDHLDQPSRGRFRGGRPSRARGGRRDGGAGRCPDGPVPGRPPGLGVPVFGPMATGGVFRPWPRRGTGQPGRCSGLTRPGPRDTPGRGGKLGC